MVGLYFEFVLEVLYLPIQKSYVFIILMLNTYNVDFLLQFSQPLFNIEKRNYDAVSPLRLVPFCYL